MGENKKMKRHVIGYILLIAALILAIQNIGVVLGAAGKFLTVLKPLTLGCAMAYILNILMKRIEKIYAPDPKNKWVKKSKRGVCIVLSLLVIVGILGLVVGLVVPELVSALVVIAEGVPVYFEKFTKWLMAYSDQFPLIEEYIGNLEIDWQQIVKNMVGYVTSGVSGILNSTISVVAVITGGIVNFSISLIFAVYILYNKEKLTEQMKKLLAAYFSVGKRTRIYEVAGVADSTFSNFIVGQCTEAVILGSLCAVGMWILQFPYAPMTGAFIGVTALIPVAGAYLGAGVGAFMIFTVDPMKAVLFLIFIVCLQQLEGNLIYPKVVGSSVGLPALWVLAAVTVGGGINGIFGMLLGVPIAATLYKLMKLDVTKRLIRKGEIEEQKPVLEETIVKEKEQEEENT